MSELTLDVVIQIFLVEAEDNLAEMEEALLALEDAPEDAEQLARLFRVVHSFKGAAASLGFGALAEFAHAMEDVLAALRDRQLLLGQALAGTLLAGVDALRHMVTQPSRGGDRLSPQHEALAETLRAHLRGEDLPRPLDPAALPEAEPDAPAAPEVRRTMRVEVDKLDRLLNLVAELAIDRSRVAAQLEARGAPAADLLESFRDGDRLHMELQELVLKARMVPVGPTFRQHLRTVRDVAAATGKQARLLLEGEGVEVDTGVVERLRDPLMHLLRNAVHHGIEAPADRAARGKSPGGLLHLRARQEGGSLVVELADDGAGLDRERIAARARKLGLAEAPETLPDEELFRFIFAEGFTTTEQVSTVSGRGVGLDVVRRNIEGLRGQVSVTSRPGLGTTFTLRVPLTLSIIEGFRVGVGEDTFVLPLDMVEECVELPRGAHARGDGVLNLRGQALPFVRLRTLFSLPPATPARESVVVVRHGGERAGFAVDHLLGQGSTVVKPLHSLFRGLPGVSGTSLLGTGRVALVLDVPALLSRICRTHASAA